MVIFQKKHAYDRRAPNKIAPKKDTDAAMKPMLYVCTPINLATVSPLRKKAASKIPINTFHLLFIYSPRLRSSEIVADMQREENEPYSRNQAYQYPRVKKNKVDAMNTLMNNSN